MLKEKKLLLDNSESIVIVNGVKWIFGIFKGMKKSVENIKIKWQHFSRYSTIKNVLDAYKLFWTPINAVGRLFYTTAGLSTW